MIKTPFSAVKGEPNYSPQAKGAETKRLRFHDVIAEQIAATQSNSAIYEIRELIRLYDKYIGNGEVL